MASACAMTAFASAAASLAFSSGHRVLDSAGGTRMGLLLRFLFIFAGLRQRVRRCLPILVAAEQLAADPIKVAGGRIELRASCNIIRTQFKDRAASVG